MPLSFEEQLKKDCPALSIFEGMGQPGIPGTIWDRISPIIRQMGLPTGELYSNEIFGQKLREAFPEPMQTGRWNIPDQEFVKWLSSLSGMELGMKMGKPM